MKSARVAVAVAAVVAVAGCSTPSGSTAFRVAGTTVSDKQVDDTTAACASVAGQDAQKIRSAVANFMLRGSLVQPVEQKTGTTLTAAELDKAVQNSQAGSLMNDPTCASMVKGVAAFSALATKLGDAKMRNALNGIKVVTNPSYGTYDPTRAAFDGSSGSLSREDVGQGKVFGN